jgi:hypothetical protein
MRDQLRQRKAIATAIAVVVVLCAAEARGQGADDGQVAALRGLAEVYVTPIGSTAAVRGRLVELGPETLTLIDKQGRRDIALSEVSRIEVSGDPLKNGALIGAGIFFGLACAAVCHEDFNGPVLTILTVETLLGAAVGTAFDAMNRGLTPIYARSNASATVYFAPHRSWTIANGTFLKRVRF